MVLNSYPATVEHEHEELFRNNSHRQIQSRNQARIKKPIYSTSVVIYLPSAWHSKFKNHFKNVWRCLPKIWFMTEWWIYSRPHATRLSIFSFFNRSIQWTGRVNRKFETKQCKFTTLKRFLRVNCNSICILALPAVLLMHWIDDVSAIVLISICIY